MSATRRTITVINSAMAATILAGAAALASPASTGPTSADGSMAGHMGEMDPDLRSEMSDMMAGDATLGEMHQWMQTNGIDLGGMHRDMTAAGMPPGSMHRNMAP